MEKRVTPSRNSLDLKHRQAVRKRRRNPQNGLSHKMLQNVFSAETFESEPHEQLRSLGFTDDAIEQMLRAEHDDWCRYYLAADWKH